MSINMVADANPTKDFFIYMITKDIGLSRAILDLIDNCVDGAIRLRNTQRFDGLFVNILVDKDHFHISDNCGGIDIDVARKYAFRFGRSSEEIAVKHSIGQFGVGMKRALFKLGSVFEITSKTVSNSFSMIGDVNTWKDSPEWSFTFNTADEKSKNSLEDTGTIINITNLLSNVSENFNLENFKKELSIEISEAHQKALSNGLAISFNGIPLKFKEIELLNSDLLKPVSITKTIQLEDKIDVVITIIAGIGESEPKDAGWYVYCNGRLVLNADQTNTTGWGEENGALIPQFHNRSAYFRGYVFFESDKASALPWNTTKTGIDIDSRLYKMTKQDMIAIMRPIIDVLNQYSREKDPANEDKIVTPIIESAKKTPINNLPENAVFSVMVKKQKISAPVTESIISYKRSIEKIKKVKKSLDISSNKEIGEYTFDYYYEMECK